MSSQRWPDACRDPSAVTAQSSLQFPWQMWQTPAPTAWTHLPFPSGTSSVISTSQVTNRREMEQDGTTRHTKTSQPPPQPLSAQREITQPSEQPREKTPRPSPYQPGKPLLSKARHHHMLWRGMGRVGTIKLLMKQNLKLDWLSRFRSTELAMCTCRRTASHTHTTYKYTQTHLYLPNNNFLQNPVSFSLKGDEQQVKASHLQSILFSNVTGRQALKLY